MFMCVQRTDHVFRENCVTTSKRHDLASSVTSTGEYHASLFLPLHAQRHSRCLEMSCRGEKYSKLGASPTPTQAGPKPANASYRPISGRSVVLDLSGGRQGQHQVGKPEARALSPRSSARIYIVEDAVMIGLTRLSGPA